MSIIFSKQQDGTINVIAAGNVTRDSEIKQTGNTSRVKFSIAYGKKMYLDCEAYADSDVGAVASCLEKGDTIAVMGVHKTWDYNGRQYSRLQADMIFTLASPMMGAAPMQTDDAPAAQNENAQSYSQKFNEIDDTEEELPF